MLKPDRFEPPRRRVLAVDAGSRCLRLLLLIMLHKPEEPAETTAHA